MEIKNFDKTRGKFLLEIKHEFQNINKALKVSRLLATSLEILVANTKFSVALATSWLQFRTLEWTTVVLFGGSSNDKGRSPPHPCITRQKIVSICITRQSLIFNRQKSDGNINIYKRMDQQKQIIRFMTFNKRRKK